MEEEAEEVDWSKGQGKSVDIPEYLWWKKGAVIRLRNLSKRDTELFIKDVWKAKKIADAMKKDKSDIHKFIMQYCQKKFGNFQNVIVENMASLMHAIELHREDADIEMFGEILAGRLEETVYTAQVHWSPYTFHSMPHTHVHAELPVVDNVLTGSAAGCVRQLDEGAKEAGYAAAYGKDSWLRHVLRFPSGPPELFPYQSSYSHRTAHARYIGGPSRRK